MSNIESPHINPLGFREYDARWLYPKDINLEGIKNVGLGFGTQIISKKSKNPIIAAMAMSSSPNSAPIPATAPPRKDMVII